MHLIKNKPESFKDIKAYSYMVDKHNVHMFKIELDLPNVKNMKINFITTKNSKNMIAIIYLDFEKELYNNKDEIEKRNNFFFNYFNKKNILDYFFETPISSKMDDDYSSDSAKIRFTGLPKFNPENEFMFTSLLECFPELINLTNKDTINFIYKNIRTILSDTKGSEKPQLEVLSKTFELNSNEFKDAIMLEYAS